MKKEFHLTSVHKTLFTKIVFFFTIYIFYYFQIQLHCITLDLFGNELHKFFNLFFMRLLQSYDLNCKFHELTQLTLFFFF